MSENDKKVLVMYDVRGIQNYIFRTAKLKDAIGASALVENIFEETLETAVNCVKDNGNTLSADLQWFDENGPRAYKESGKDVVVLYIGGGNAYVMMRNKRIAVAVTKKMSREVIEKTYSLQLAAAMVEVTGNYSEDYENLNIKMAEVKANMIVSKPIGALPIMEVEIKTGYPAVGTDPLTKTVISCESQLKKSAGDAARRYMSDSEKKMEEYITEKEVDSTIAVVHIDGNNMGLRIRGLVEGITNYEKAVNRMREISYNINTSFKKAFDEMKEFFNKNAPKVKAFRKKKSDYYLVKVIAAGDDITYVCNGKIAIATVEFFAKNVSKRTMISEESSGLNTEEDIRRYGFSVCAGISFVGSHFPFNIAYDVAESCCGAAKNAAKTEENKDGDNIGNWFDFMFCRNVQTRNLEDMRKREYETRCREKLLCRPYFIPTNEYAKGSIFGDLSEGRQSLADLKQKLSFFGNEKNIPHSQAKDLRNTYPLGQGTVEMLMQFLASRKVKFPDGSDAYYEEKEEKVAMYYDALELMDMYVSLEEVIKSAKEAK